MGCTASPSSAIRPFVHEANGALSIIRRQRLRRSERTAARTGAAAKENASASSSGPPHS
jgi:hypothetical protein